MISFSATLLAGGKSSRMGRDKALVRLSDSDLLWQHQWRTLQELQPEEIFWSGSSRPGLPEEIHIVPDAVPSAGPLAGLGASLDILRSDFLVVLAIDLPQMNETFLRSLLARCSAGCGAVAHHGDFFEPLAAVYPRQLRSLVATHLSEGRHVMQDLVREAVKQGLLKSYPLEETDLALFKNLNRPSDLAEFLSHRTED
jgi:molybdopterin-guanine dinucleotide biosynthesis protein A